MFESDDVEEEQIQLQAVEIDANYDDRVQRIKSNDLIDLKFGFERYTGAAERSSWLINFQPSEVIDEQSKAILSSVDFYFIEDGGKRFKVSYPFRPYFYICATDGNEHQVTSFLSKKYGFLTSDIVEKEDLDLKNHLSGLKRTYIKLSFPSTSELGKVKRDILPNVRKNKERIKRESQYCSYLARLVNMGESSYDVQDDDVMSNIIDIREYDVPYHMRVAIDEKFFIGKWYSVRGISANRRPSIVSNPALMMPVDPIVLAFDIETTKLPLKFPDSASDEIMMISYMVDGKGFLVINRDIVSEDIEQFEYTPREEFKGEFSIFNEINEIATIRRFFDHILEVQPNIIVTYNGDFFDWPFVETRARIRGINMMEEIGFSKDSLDEYKSRNCAHMDAFRWVKRDSYLPMGSQNLKAVAKAKLGYDPIEVDPEEMCKMAREEPQVSFILSYPLLLFRVLRKGSGTLCEALLMVEAFQHNIIFPNKFVDADEVKCTSDGHRIDSETYVGGHVEALQAGIFRADIPCRFRLVPAALKSLRDSVPKTLERELLRECNISLDSVLDFDERCAEVQETFNNLLAIPARMENPRIYHLDVGAMYPNIILTNRLQPCAVVNEEVCMACSYNRPDAKCKRIMDWEWRGELVPASRGELQQIIQQLEGETFGKPPRAFRQLDKKERQFIEKKRIQDYSRRVYGRTHLARTEMRQTMICQRENSFYVDTVKAFRDRRYEYKELLKKAKLSLSELPRDDLASIKAAKGRVTLYESLQLAHKCILNSFYGYVMRKGSRWFSMEMAGIVCHTGAKIITEARKLVEQIGKPLELDTDGIWCLLPASFPENVTFALKNHKRRSVTVSYPGAMLNALVNEGFTNDQYHNLQPDGSYTISEENSIFFEVDGPYQCMVLPASKEEGKKLKKRYAVFNLDGSLAELKGFEVKRRGELNIIKHFQSAVFKAFLRGSSLAEVYESASREANYWLDVLFTKGGELTELELFDLISENRSMSRKLEDYGGQKSTSISTARRLAEFLGTDMVKDAGLACKFVISRHPLGSPVTERAVPIAIFQDKVKFHYLKLWTKQPSLSMDKMNIKELLDWDYYIERLGSCIQKIITIPAALQGLPNPVPRIPHPDWLANKLKNRYRIEKRTLMQHGFDEWLKFLKLKWRLLKVSCGNRKKESGRDTVSYLFLLFASMCYPFHLRAYYGRTNDIVVRRVLPHHKPVHYFVEQRLLDEINEKLCSSRVEGIYESQVPLIFRAVSQIGCLCRPLAPPLSGVYSLETLKMIPMSSSESYLPRDFVRVVFVYKFSQDSREVWAVIDEGASAGSFFIVQRGEVAMPNMDKIYTQIYEKEQLESISHISAAIKFTTRHFRLATEAEKEINRVDLFFGCVHVSFLSITLSVIIRFLQAKRVVNLSLFPHVRISVQEPSSLLNVMEWQRVIAKRICKHFFNSFIYMKDYADWARYLHAPIGSVPNDAGIFGLDLFFARNLQRAGHVLWASPSSRPDLGGKELDDLRLCSDWKPLSKDETVLLNTPSFCDSFCVEFELEAVALTALVQRGRLLDAEGTDDAVAFDSTVVLLSDVYSGLNTISAFDEGAAVDAALKILKHMLMECVRDIAHSANKRADQVVMSWLHSPNSLLYDSAITRSITILEKKLVLLLVAECERLGSKVLHAAPARLVLDTGKCDREQGAAFTDLLLQSLGQNPLFAALHMRPIHRWSTLLWYDAYNHTEYWCTLTLFQIYKALSCDSAVEDSVENLRENLYRILDTTELPHPKNTIYLPNIFCNDCSLATTLDVGDKTSWTCKECGQLFLKSYIDEMIAERVNTLLTAFLLQDHICSKCKLVGIRQDNLSKYCECSGTFVNVISADEFLRDMRTAGEIGEEFELPMTVEVSRWIIAGINLDV
ncbi:unnamed protein product [Angiostrongylus costaricensis]|uniref:DNA polymerase epsilon catalytic subunit n=1 Tax=Angiostrongylus costaricensis TaxID=334426 RepID=A0A0R3PSE1_ANGCS|nr:unnamed protein product [Angiostrongylus costaricensis]